MKYINKQSTNKTESEVQKYFLDNGYQSIKRGWPDFCFWKKEKGKKPEVIFVEVKRSNQSGIKTPQRKIKNIFKKLGLDHRIAFGVLEDGSPNYAKHPGLNS